MSLEVKNLKETACDNCGVTVVEALNMGDSMYICYDCETAICEACYEEKKENPDEELFQIICPECGAEMFELTEEDIQKPSFDEMFD